MGSVQWHWTVLGLVKYLEQFSKIFTLDSARTCVTIVTRSCVTAAVCVSSLVTVTSVMKNRQQKVLQSLQSFFVTNITTNLISYILWSSVDSFSIESFIFLPLLHLVMATISEKIQTIWKSKSDDDKNLSHIISLETQNRLKLRELLEAQHRMMYYTVTISTVPSVLHLPEHITKRKTSCLKWQYASTLYKTQATMRKSTVQSATYYSITYLGELLENDEDEEINEAVDEISVARDK